MLTLRLWATVAAGLSAVLFVLYGLLLRSIAGRQPPTPHADPAFVEGVKLLFVVVGVLLAALHAWRYVSVARAAGAGTLELRHRRRLRKTRTTAVWSPFALSVICAVVTWRLPAAVPLAVTCLLVAVGWAVAAVACVRAERADAEHLE